MSDNNKTVECYAIPSLPMPLLLPVECVADIVAKPSLQPLKKGSTVNWMKGHGLWNNQRLSVISYAALLDAELDESKKRNPSMVVLNPIPHAARMAYAGLMCYGKVETIKVDNKAQYIGPPEGVDRRYIEQAVKIGKKEYLIPKLSALGVAFTYV